MRLKHRVAIGKNGGRAPSPDMGDDLECAGIEPIGEGIIEQPIGHRQKPRLMEIFAAQALQRTKIVGVAEARPQFLENRPIAPRHRLAETPSKLVAEILLKAVVVE